MKQFQPRVLGKNKKKQGGFTLIELVIVIVIAGILGAALVTTYVNLSAEAISANVSQSDAALQSNIAIGIAQAPVGTGYTVTELAAALQGNAAAIATGITTDIEGTTYTALTFTDATCTAATADVGDNVLCATGFAAP